MSRIEPTPLEVVEAELRWKPPKKHCWQRSLASVSGLSADNWVQVIESYAWRADNARCVSEEDELREVAEHGDTRFENFH